MQRNRRRLLAAAAAGATGLMAGCAGASSRAQETTTRGEPTTDGGATTGEAGEQAGGYTVEVRTHRDHGVVLTDAEGMTLYRFTQDEGTESACYDQCAEAWPPLTVEESPTVPDGLPGEVGTTERRDGSTQVTYDGMPLYYWQDDEEPGDATGHGVNDVWFVVNPACPGETETTTS